MDANLLRRVLNERARLAKLEADLRARGEKEIAAAVKRAFRELAHTPVTGAENTQEVEHARVRN